MSVSNKSLKSAQVAHDELRRWPYTLHQIDDTLDINLIEGRGKQILFQALNARRLTAFVGSGVSAAYGRLGWAEWKTEQLRFVDEKASGFIKLGHLSLEVMSLAKKELEGHANSLRNFVVEAERSRSGQDDPDASTTDIGSKLAELNHTEMVESWLGYRIQVTTRIVGEIEVLNNSFQAAKSDNGTFPGGEDLPIVFEIAKKLHEHLERNTQLLKPSVGEHSLSRYLGTSMASVEGAPVESGEAIQSRIKKWAKGENQKKLIDFELIRNEFTDLLSSTEFNLDFDELAKHLLVDERAHAYQMFTSSFVAGGTTGRKLIGKGAELARKHSPFAMSNLKRDLDGIRDNPEAYQVLKWFKLDVLECLALAATSQSDALPGVPTSFDEVAKAIIEIVRISSGKTSQSGVPIKANRVFVTPTSRFLVPFLSQLSTDPHWFWKNVTETVTETDFLSRRSIMDPALDPLGKVIGGLKINRFLTTNYDFEIERQFIDRGYRRFDDFWASPAVDPEDYQPGRRTVRVNGLGGVMKDMSFSVQTSADLLCFASGADHAEASVFHLHGRATEQSKIVATERDYMDQYLRSGPNREVIDESIQMAFGATPTLFLGLGMEEADVLRPLRQFMSDKDRESGFQSVVLLPATKDLDSRSKMSAGLYLRYGAHTIYYGGGTVDIQADENCSEHCGKGNIDDGDGKSTVGSVKTGTVGSRELDWLHHIQKLISTLKKAATEALKKSAAENGTPVDFSKPLLTIEELAEDLGEFNLNEDSGPGRDLVLAALLGKKPRNFKLFCENLNNALGAGREEAKSLLRENFELQNCKFFSMRLGAGEGPSSSQRVTRESAPYSRYYVKLLTELVKVALLPDMGRNQDEFQRGLTAMVTAMDGLTGALITASFNASLDMLEKEWRNWWIDWQQEPPQREASFEEIKFSDHETADEQGDNVILPQRFVRHRIKNVITDLRHCDALTSIAPDTTRGFGREFEGQIETNVQVFDSFLQEVARIGSESKPAKGRLIHTIAATRGQGKGVTFTAFTTRLGLTRYFRAAHPNMSVRRQGAISPFVCGAFFINLSFSAEIGSVFDMLVNHLTEVVAKIQTARNEEPMYRGTVLNSKKALEEFLGSQNHGVLNDEERKKLNAHVEKRREKLTKKYANVRRSHKLQKLLFEFMVAAKEFGNRNFFRLAVTPRLFFCVNAIDILYDPRQKPKNMEIADVLRFLTSKEAGNIPMDLVLMGDLNRAGVRAEPGLGKHAGATPQRVTLQRKEILQDQQRFISVQAQALNVTELKHAKNTDPALTNFVHFAHRLEPKRFLVDNFLPLAMALYIARKVRNGALVDPDQKIESAATDAFRLRQENRNAAWSGLEFPDSNEVLQNSREMYCSGIVDALVEADSNRFRSIANEKDRLSAMKAFLLKDYDDANDDTASKEWEEAFKVFGRNRFSLTILLAAAEHLIITSHKLSEGGQTADEFLQTVVSRVRNVSISKRESEVLDAVLAVYQEHSLMGEPDHDHELHMHLLRNIAVMGCPVSANVLVRLPDIRDYFNRVKMSGEVRRRRIVARALAVLCARGLLFRLSPHPKLLRLRDAIEENLKDIRRNNPEDLLNDIEARVKQEGKDDRQPLVSAIKSFDKCPADYEFRYALHRQVQNHCFRRLGHMTAAPVTANNFAPTLYSAMPSRVVRLSSEGYLFLRRLLLGLSQYPDIRHEDTARDIPVFSDDDPITRVQALRCAMSLARTSFSLAAVSRFSDETDGLGFSRKRGYFETYRVRLRWLLRKAWEVHEPRESADPKNYRVNALYFDEIVWLYNEIAVTCFAQGALVEAVGHARQALHMNRRIEGLPAGGRMHAMISLNLAIIQFERGRLTSAERRLDEICKYETDHKPRVYWLAQGYRALIQQIRGHREEATVGLRNAIEGLQEGEENRALALMTLHLARTLAHKDPDEALRLMARARDYAESGGHEDVRHRVMVSEVWVSQIHAAEPWLRRESDAVKLREILQYARMMGMHSLQVEALHAQGRMLLISGDQSGSGKVLTRAMMIARRHDMNLRLTSIMTSYSDVLLVRRRVSSAKRLLASALALAKGSGFSTEVVRIHETLERAEQLTPAVS